jgi:hypothetical protein
MGYKIIADTLGATVTNGKKSITTSSGEIFDTDETRKTLILTNDSDYDVWLGFGEAAVADEGLLLAAYGGYLQLDTYSMYEGKIYAIAIGTNTTIAYTQGVI